MSIRHFAIAALFLPVTLLYAEVAGSDQTFMKKAAQGGMTEVKLGEIASSKGQHAGVKDFGKAMVADHGKANEELKALATKKAVQLPAGLDAKHQDKVDDLSKLSGAEFDKAYVKAMVDDHQKTVSLFEDAAKSAKDAEVKGFAEKTLPTLRKHLEHVQGLQKETAK